MFDEATKVPLVGNPKKVNPTVDSNWVKVPVVNVGLMDYGKDQSHGIISHLSARKEENDIKAKYDYK